MRARRRPCPSGGIRRDSWYGFAGVIVEGLKARGATLAVERIVPIATEDYPTKARRPRNSRLDLARLQTIFGITPPPWQNALLPELDRLARELTTTNGVALRGKARIEIAGISAARSLNAVIV